jgi:hypothetical protein
MKNAIYYSDRGFPLVFTGVLRQGSSSVLTVENYLKWYSLYLVEPDGSVRVIEFPDEFCDHVPYPASVQKLANDNGWFMCSESMEMIVGRFVLEVECREIGDMKWG